MYVYIYVIYIYIYTYTSVYLYTICAYMYIYIYTHIHTHLYNMYIYIYIYILYICVWCDNVYIHIRYLEYDNHVHPQILISSGVPQGCPIAPLTLATWMSSGATAVQSLMQSEANVTAEASRQAVTRIYMDDRSWIDSNYDRALQRATQWHTWSARVGLRESLEKIQACAKPSRLQDIARQDRPDWTIQDTVKVLRVSLRPKRMANTRLEQSRLYSSLSRAKILSCLPVPYHRKIELYRMFVVPKALYGWIVRFPTKADSNKIFNALSRMTGTNRMANPLIRSIIYGGACHLQILLAIRLFKRLCRMRCRGTAVWTNVPGTPSKKFRDWLKDWGWREISPWIWQRNAHTLCVPVRTEVDTYCHQIRMAWRHELLRKWAGGKRHEAEEWRRLTSPLQMKTEMENVDLEAVRRIFMTSEASSRAVLLGSVVSPAWMGRAHADEDPLCPWCTRAGNFLHIAWQCRAFPLSASRPIKPSSWLLSRFGWPQTSTSSHQQQIILRWLASVQEQIWLVRHGSCRTSGDSVARWGPGMVL